MSTATNKEEGKQPSSAALQSHLMQRMRTTGVYSTVAAFVGLAFMIIQNEIAWSSNTTMGLSSRFCEDARDVSCDPRDAIRMFPITEDLLTINIIRGACISLSTLIALVFHYMYFQNTLRYMISRNQVPATSSLFTSPLLFQYLVEAIILAIHVFPKVEELSESPLLYLCLSHIMLLRFLLLVRVLVLHSRLNSSNGRFISALTNVEFSPTFILKTVIKDRSFVIVCVTLGILLFSAAYAVRNIESLVCSFDRSLGCFPISFEDSLWLIIITMTTVGYGDITTKTAGARLAVLVGGIGGTVVLAAAVVLFADGMALSRSEAKVLTFLRKHEHKRKLTAAAALVIQTAHRVHRLKRGGFAQMEQAEQTRRQLAQAADASRKQARSDYMKWLQQNKHKQLNATVSPTKEEQHVVREASNVALRVAPQPLATRRSPQCGCLCRAHENNAGNPENTDNVEVLAYERLLYQRIEEFRSVKRYVASHDPTDPTDRQLTLLETLEVNVDDIRGNVDMLCTLLLGDAQGDANAVFTEDMQRRLAELTTEKGKPSNGTNATRMLANAIKTRKHQRDGGAIETSSQRKANEGAIGLQTAISTATTVNDNDTAPPAVSETTALNQTVHLLTSNLHVAVTAFTKLQQEFEAYKRLTTDRLDSLEQSLRSNGIHIQLSSVDAAVFTRVNDVKIAETGMDTLIPPLAATTTSSKGSRGLSHSNRAALPLLDTSAHDTPVFTPPQPSKVLRRS